VSDWDGKQVEKMQSIIVDNAKVTEKGQITLPKDICESLCIGAGDRVTLICEGDRLVMMNSAIYAMKTLQKEMEGEAGKAGLYSDDDVVDLIMEMRYGEKA
jgi:AbrB family looped-hinge helix DNA binding protein